MGLTHSFRFAKDFGVLPNFLSVAELRRVFRDSNIGPVADDHQVVLNLEEFCNAVHCVAELARGRVGQPGRPDVNHIRELLQLDARMQQGGGSDVFTTDRRIGHPGDWRKPQIEHSQIDGAAKPPSIESIYSQVLRSKMGGPKQNARLHRYGVPRPSERQSKTQHKSAIEQRWRI